MAGELRAQQRQRLILPAQPHTGAGKRGARQSPVGIVFFLGCVQPIQHAALAALLKAFPGRSGDCCQHRVVRGIGQLLALVQEVGIPLQREKYVGQVAMRRGEVGVSAFDLEQQIDPLLRLAGVDVARNKIKSRV